MSRKSKNKVYFGPDIELAIQKFNIEENEYIKARIYKNQIHPALDKLAENCINTWKFWKYETTYIDLKNDLITFFYERLKLINPVKGKAFSFFTFSARNFLIKYNIDLDKKIKGAQDLKEIDQNRNIINEVTLTDYNEDLKDFIDVWSVKIIDNLDLIFKSKTEKKIAEAVSRLMQLAQDLETFNKKELYILIREYSKVETQYITKTVNKLKVMFFDCFKEWSKTREVNLDKYLL